MFNKLKIGILNKIDDAKKKFGRTYVVTVRCYLYKQYKHCYWSTETEFNDYYDREMLITHFNSYFACKVAEIYGKQDPLVEKVMVIRCVIRKKI